MDIHFHGFVLASLQLQASLSFQISFTALKSLFVCLFVFAVASCVKNTPKEEKTVCRFMQGVEVTVDLHHPLIIIVV